MKRIMLLALASLLSACSSQFVLDSNTSYRTISKPLYLRGEFSLWDAQQEYVFKKASDSAYVAKVKFSKAGVAYEFKIADKDWSEGLNCGYLSEAKDKNLIPGKTVRADCNSIYNYFRFTPEHKGWYQVWIAFPGYGAPQVRIERLLEM